MLARLVWTLLAWRRNPGWRWRLARIRRLNRQSPEAFRVWHAEAVRRHVDWAIATIPFFRECARPGARLTDLPVLTRDLVQTRGDDLRDPTRPVERLIRGTSGGSTGRPVVLWHDRAYYVWDQATEVFVLGSWGLAPWCSAAYVWGADRDLAYLTPKERMWMALLRRHSVDAFQMGEDALAAAADEMARIRPVYIQGYVSALELLARWLLEHRPDHGIRPRVIRATAETVTADARRTIERAFGGRVYDFYGSRESASIAVECPEGGMHVQAHARHVEIVGPEDRPLDPGEPGRILVTDFTNQAFGLLRYETGDVAAWSTKETPCRCGCPYPRLEKILGRTSDFITTPAGERIHGEWFTHLFYGRDGVRRFQVRQPDIGRLEVRTVGTAVEADLTDLLDAVRTRMGASVEVRWIPVDEIETTATGKYRFTKSDVPYRPETA